MKLSKLMLTMAVAASAFAACNKQETTPVVNEVGNKSIVLNIANLTAPTKATGTEATVGATQVVLNDYQVFFTDGINFYTPMNDTASADAETYFEYEDDEDAPKNPDAFHQFHFLDKAVNAVIVIGNAGKKLNPTNVTALWEMYKNLAIVNQQEQGNLFLYGADYDITETTDNHYVTPPTGDDKNKIDQHPEPVYLAKVKLMPAVARFEIVGYNYAQVMKDGAAQTREYSEMTVNSQSLIGFYESAAVSSASDTDWTVNPSVMHTHGWDAVKKTVVTYTWDNVYQDYFTQVDKDAWYYDAVAETVLKEGAWNKDLATKAEGATTYSGNAYAYHVFPSTVKEVTNVVPSFIFQLTAVEQGVKSLLYLQTRSLGIDKVEAGKVYQMYVEFTDEALRDAEKCIDVEITVHDWEVSVVTPNFGTNN